MTVQKLFLEQLPIKIFLLDFIRITLVATGFEKRASQGINNSEFENKEAASAKPRVVVRATAMVANGDYSEDFLDVPTFMRQQKD